MTSPRRLRPGQDIYRIAKMEHVHPDDPQWWIFRFTYGHDIGGFRVSEHHSRDEARAAKKEHERKLDERQKFRKVGAL